MPRAARTRAARLLRAPKPPHTAPMRPSLPISTFSHWLERRFTALLFVLTGVALVLRLTRLGAQSFWIDGVLSYGWIDQIREQGFASLVHNIHGPLHAVSI